MNGHGRLGRRTAAAALLALAVGACDAAPSPDVPATTSTPTSISASPAPAGPSTGSARSYPTGDDPQMVVAADLTGDGVLDLATANGGSPTVSVLRGLGDGGFAEPREEPAGLRHAIGLTASDLNGDASTDLVVTNGAPSGAISVLLNEGGGTFAATQLDGGHQPQAVTTADLDRDGVADVIAANGLGGLTVWLGRGDGSFGAPADLSTASTMCSWVATADVNGDGAIDLITANSRLGQGASDGSVSVLLGTGHGSFQTPVVYADVAPQPTMIIAADVDGDGSVDLVVPGGYPSTGDAVLLGHGDGAFADPLTVVVGSSPHSAAVADLDGDGTLDLVSGNLGTSFDPDNPNGDVAVQPGLGDASFGPGVTIENPFPTFVAVADLDGDGSADVIALNELADTVEVVLGGGAG